MKLKARDEFKLNVRNHESHSHFQVTLTLCSIYGKSFEYTFRLKGTLHQQKSGFLLTTDKAGSYYHLRPNGSPCYKIM